MLLVAPPGGAMCFVPSCVFRCIFTRFRSNFLPRQSNSPTLHTVPVGSPIVSLGRCSVGIAPRYDRRCSCTLPHVPPGISLLPASDVEDVDFPLWFAWAPSYHCRRHISADSPTGKTPPWTTSIEQTGNNCWSRLPFLPARRPEIPRFVLLNAAPLSSIWTPGLLCGLWTVKK